jgi:hypothetical protein
MLWATAMQRGHSAPIWMTFRQARELGAHVRKGEKGALVVYASKLTPRGALPWPGSNEKFPRVIGHIKSFQRLARPSLMSSSVEDAARVGQTNYSGQINSLHANDGGHPLRKGRLTPTPDVKG